MELGIQAIWRGDYVQSDALAVESLELLRSLGDKGMAFYSLSTIGYAALHRGDLRQAAASQVEGLHLAWDTGFQRGVAFGLEGVAAAIAMPGGDLHTARKAALLYGTADALRREIDQPLPPADRALNTRSIDAARATLGDDAFAEAWAAGAKLPLAEAVRIASAEGTAAATRAPRETTPPSATLSPREWDVARLAARGYTNQQIGERLGMSIRTAETHLRNLLRKLGLSSRRELAGRFESSDTDDPLSAPPTGT
jgi:DNA-binding CsgD family transcriptional regulator